MLSRARQILISELTFAFDQPEDETEAMLDRVLEEAH
jgi:RNA polymerase-interacting CarD/CdnL/TRCF family regulator